MNLRRRRMLEAALGGMAGLSADMTELAQALLAIDPARLAPAGANI